MDENKEPEKRCTGKYGCNTVKPLTAFYKDAHRSDGRAGICRECGVRKCQIFKRKPVVTIEEEAMATLEAMVNCFPPLCTGYYNGVSSPPLNINQ